MEKNKISAVLVEDDSDIRQSIVELLSKSEKIILLKSFSSGEELLNHISGLNPDLILMDIHLPGISGIDCTSELKKLFPEILILMLTVYEDDDSVFNSLEAGASGYLIKKNLDESLFDSIDELVSGGSPMSPQIARKVVQSFQKKSKKSSEELETLTNQEENILQFLAKGYQYKEIAEKIFVSSFTVKTHLRNIYRKLHVRSRTEAVVKFLQK